MANWKALAVGLLAAAGVFALLFVGQVLRWVTRMVSWAALVLLVVFAGYVAYELYAGWTADAADARRERDDAATEASVTEDEGTTEGFSDEALDRELDELLADEPDDEVANQRDVEVERDS